VHSWVEPQVVENLERRILLQDMSNDLLDSKLEVVFEILHSVRLSVGIVAYWLARKSINVGCRTLNEVAQSTNTCLVESNMYWLVGIILQT
jgi:hypothetical protein